MQIFPIILTILILAEIALSFKKKHHYRNINGVIAAFSVSFIQLVVAILMEIFPPGSNAVILDVMFGMINLQIAVILFVKIYFNKKDAYTRYGIPLRYTTGLRHSLISLFYDFDKNSPNVNAKAGTTAAGYLCFACALIVLVNFYVQAYWYSTWGNTLFLPVSGFGIISLLTEMSIFLNGSSLWGKLLKKYRSRIGCASRRELAKARYSEVEDYEYIFVKNHMWEESHITRATKLCWKTDSEKPTIEYYNFADKTTGIYTKQQFNPALEDFISSNQLEVNKLYVAAYNLINDNQNVLVNTPSYVEFEPYLTALLKMKIAKTQKTILVVSNEEKKLPTIKKLQNAFEEYFGFENIPFITTIDECAKRLEEEIRFTKELEKNRSEYYHSLKLTEFNKTESDEIKAPVKDADIIIAAPEDICDIALADTVQNLIKSVGLIVYYDFSDCVQEEALFARIIHSVIDYDDKCSTLYMSDGFFDLEQVVDNFFSRRNLYRITVPRRPSENSYVTGWKAENINEMQARTYSDASRNIGNHIPVIYDGCSHTANDFMVVEDEYDAYFENFANITGDSIAARLDCHVGWTDVMGGNSVYCSVSDTYNNAAHTYRALSGIGAKSEYINIISRPYLLRNYLMYNLRHFATRPGGLSSYSPGEIKTPRAIAYEACIKAHISGCNGEQLIKYADKAGVSVDNSPEAILSALVTLAYGEEGCKPKITNDIYDRFFIDRETYGKIISKSGLVDKISFVNNNKIIQRNRRNYPSLMPQQKIVLNGVKYTVESVEGNRVEITDSNLREAIFVNRVVRTANLNITSCQDHNPTIQKGSDSSISFRQLTADAEITLHGNIVFKDNYHPLSKNCRFDYIEVTDKPVNKYNDVNVFAVKFSAPFINGENSEALAHMLTILFYEMMPTFFPRYSDRIIMGCNGWSGSSVDKETISSLNIVSKMNINDPEPVNDNEICLYILEDSPIETGLINVFWQDEEFRYMLKILEDYLYYQEMVRREEFQDIFSAEHKELLHTLRKSLLRIINETLDTPGGTESPKYLNSLRRTRFKFNALEMQNHFNLCCDFCGKPIKSKYHFYEYSGKTSCMNCYKDAVCSEKHTYDDIDVYHSHILDWLFKRYKVTVNPIYYNYLEDAEFLADEMHAHNGYIITDGPDLGGILGLAADGESCGYPNATCNDEYIPVMPTPGYSGDPVDLVRAAYYITDAAIAHILICNGLREKDYLGVLAHEVTHQWQFQNLDFTYISIGAPAGKTDEFGLPSDMSLFRLEGHCEWQKTRYLMRLNPFKAYKEIAALRARTDAYGYGYRWMARMMRLGTDDKTIPVARTFTFYMKLYFYQLTNNSFALMRLYFGKPGLNEAKEKKTGIFGRKKKSNSEEQVIETDETISPTENQSSDSLNQEDFR